MPTARLYEDPERLSRAFGERMRELRAREGVSQDNLAHGSDVHPTSIGRLERGGREPRLSTILRIAEGLGVEPGELVDRLGGGAAVDGGRKRRGGGG